MVKLTEEKRKKPSSGAAKSKPKSDKARKKPSKKK